MGAALSLDPAVHGHHPALKPQFWLGRPRTRIVLPFLVGDKYIPLKVPLSLVQSLLHGEQLLFARPRLSLCAFQLLLIQVVVVLQRFGLQTLLTALELQLLLLACSLSPSNPAFACSALLRPCLELCTQLHGLWVFRL